MKITEYYKENKKTHHYEYCCFRTGHNNSEFPEKLHNNHKDYHKTKWLHRHCFLVDGIIKYTS